MPASLLAAAWHDAIVLNVPTCTAAFAPPIVNNGQYTTIVVSELACATLVCLSRDYGSDTGWASMPISQMAPVPKIDHRA
jgi:hypothetical protein